jgi:hypothetical protein
MQATQVMWQMAKYAGVVLSLAFIWVLFFGLIMVISEQRKGSSKILGSVIVVLYFIGAVLLSLALFEVMGIHTLSKIAPWK